MAFLRPYNSNAAVVMSFTSKQRVWAAMNLQKPDRVPLMCQFSIGFMMTQLKPDPVAFWYDRETFAEGLIELCRQFRFDGILVSLHGHSDAWKKDLIRREEMEPGKVKLHYPDRVEIHSWIDLPIVEFNSPVQNPTIEAVDPEKDIPSEIDYIPVSNNLHFPLCKDHMFDIFDLLYGKVGDELSIHGEITSPFDYFLDYFGYENGLIALMLEPEKSKRILAKFTDGIVALAEGMCRKPIDAVKISSPFAGQGFISKDAYREFVLPFESRIIETIKAAGKKVYIHTCGSIGDRLELMRESGASGLECLDPVPVGNVDIEDAFERIGETMFIKGNIDSINTLLFGSDEKILQDVRHIMEVGMTKGKGFILSTACSIAPKVPRENILKLSELIQEYGFYR